MTAISLRSPLTTRRMFDRGVYDMIDDFFKDDRLLPRFMWNVSDMLPATARERCFCPSVDSYIKDNVLHLRAELPGIDLKDVDVSLDGRLLTISGERKSSHVEENVSCETREIAYGAFSRTFTVPEGVDADKIHAAYENGILEVTVSLPESLVEKHIPIEAKSIAIEEKSGEATTT